jgi:DNA-directed RNA polymerase specialized sigma24 family protein
MPSIEEWVAEVTPRVDGAALAVAEDGDAAADVTQHVMARSMAARIRDSGVPPEDRAIALVVRSSPSPAFRPLDPDDRAPVALARVQGRSVAQIATALDLDERAVRASLTRGLRAAALQVAY